MRAALVILCFGIFAVGAWVAFAKMGKQQKEIVFVSPLDPAIVEAAVNPLPSPSGPEFTLYRIPVIKVTEKTVTVKGNRGELTLSKDSLWVSKMHNNIVSNASPDALEAGQHIDLQSTRGKTTVLILL